MLFFESCLCEHIVSHPFIMPQDIVKFCYQSAFGIEQPINDAGKMLKFFEKEYSETVPSDIPIAERLDIKYTRISISAWKFGGYDPDMLFEIIMKTAPNNSAYLLSVFNQRLKIAEKIVKQIHPCFSMSSFRNYIQLYQESGIHPVYHSDTYKGYYSVAYHIAEFDLFEKTPAFYHK